MRNLKFTFFSLLLAFSFSGGSLAEDSGPQGLIQFQKQVANSIKKAQAGSQAEMVLDLVRQKFIGSVWSLSSYPTPSEVSTAKPRIQVKSPLDALTASLVPRWEIRQMQENGDCRTLLSPLTSTAANLPASYCPNSAIEFVADGTALASIEKIPATGSEQRGFIVLTNPSQFTEDERARLYTNPSFYSTSTALVALPIKFVSYVADSQNPQNIRLKVAVGDIVGEVPILGTTEEGQCTITVSRQNSSNTCDVTVSGLGSSIPKLSSTERAPTDTSPLSITTFITITSLSWTNLGNNTFKTLATCKAADKDTIFKVESGQSGVAKSCAMGIRSWSIFIGKDLGDGWNQHWFVQNAIRASKSSTFPDNNQGSAMHCGNDTMSRIAFENQYQSWKDNHCKGNKGRCTYSSCRGEYFAKWDGTKWIHASACIEDKICWTGYVTIYNPNPANFLPVP